MDQLASVAELAHEHEREEPEHNQKTLPMTSSLKSPRKRNSESDMYLSAEEKIDIKSLIASKDSYIFPRDDQLNYICVFQGCTKPILRGMNTDEYFVHLQAHANQSDRLLSNMLRRVPSGVPVDGDKKAKRRRANSTNTYNTLNIVTSKKRKDSIDGAFEKEDSNNSPVDSPSGSPSESPPRKRVNSTDEYNIPLKPSSRGVQLRDQMLRYGLHLFRIDSEGKYICFFDECSLHMMTNFSRHIAKHEKNGDKIKQELLHLCSPPVVQQQMQQHPTTIHMQNPHSHSPNHPQGPLQQLLMRHQQEALQLQQQQQQQQITVQSPAQLDQIQGFHAMQFHQLQMQHNQQLQMLQQNLSGSSSPTPHQQLAQQNPVYAPQQEQVIKRPKNVPELNLLSQVRDESDLALMRTQISKMLEDSSRNHPHLASASHQHKRSLSLAYYPSPSMQESPTLRHPYLSSHTPQMTPSASSSALLSPSSPIFSPRGINQEQQINNSNKAYFQALSPSPLDSSKYSPPLSSSSSSSSSSSPASAPPSPPASEIKWIFPKNKPVLSK